MKIKVIGIILIVLFGIVLSGCTEKAENSDLGGDGWADPTFWH